MDDNMSNIKLNYDQIDQIIISELKNTYQSLVEDLGTVDVYDSIEDHKNSIESFKFIGFSIFSNLSITFFLPILILN
jgi:hypothetical protein